MGKKTLIILALVAAWLYFAFGGDWQHHVMVMSGHNSWQVDSNLGAVALVGVLFLVALVTLGGTLLGVVLLLLLICGSLFFGLAFVSIPLWLPLLVIWLLVRPSRRVNAG
ncbi:hypothetical protein [Gallaecimonas xiamenensis]|uniref:Uncharacterized protein n=1 Tax=Gallaecimonas xiamenensis 3-C-1 TaxID=745411 RepID=K2IU08_9GAMM|nr:hypothetical protein [Gallaecimonas xiamenensis]EKE73731.1 hypothetical protein B3C1_10047 [Gallaecimonas xiamenensis 3-C-1]